MCGIAGFFGKNNFLQSNSEYIIKRMLSMIFHRGPDAYSAVLGKSFALGLARLSIVDLNGGSQPYISGDKKILVAFNGEIFNYIYLKKILINKGYTFKTNSEVETIFYLYKESALIGRCSHILNLFGLMLYMVLGIHFFDHQKEIGHCRSH